MRFSDLLIITFIIFLPFSVFGQEEAEEEPELHRMTLQELQAHASEQNHRVRIAEKEVKKAKKDVQATTAIGLPQVKASADYTNNIKRRVNLIPAEFFGGRPGTFAEVKFGTEHNAGYGVQGQQLLFDGSYFVGLKASKTYKKVASERVEKRKKEVKEMVGNAYINTLAAKEKYRSLDSTLGNIRTLYEETEAIYDEGMTEKGELDQLKRTLLNMENSIDAAQKGLRRAERSLKMLAGIPAKDSLHLTDSLEGLLSRGEKKELIGEAFHPRDHIDHRIAETRVELEHLNYQNEKADFLPKLDAFFNYEENARRNDFNFFDGEDRKWFPQTAAGVRLSIPIFNSGRKLFQAQKAKVDRLQAEVEKERVDRQLKKEFRNVRSRYVQHRRALENRREALELSEGILDRTIAKHREGTASSLEVTQTKNQYLEDRRAYIDTLSALLQARNELKEILGRY